MGLQGSAFTKNCSGCKTSRDQEDPEERCDGRSRRAAQRRQEAARIFEGACEVSNTGLGEKLLTRLVCVPGGRGITAVHVSIIGSKNGRGTIIVASISHVWTVG